MWVQQESEHQDDKPDISESGDIDEILSLSQKHVFCFWWDEKVAIFFKASVEVVTHVLESSSKSPNLQWNSSKVVQMEVKVQNYHN